MYALNLAEDGRVLSACVVLPNGTYEVTADHLPEGDVTAYRYVDGVYIYDPINVEEPVAPAFPVAPRNIVAGEYVTIDGVLYRAMRNIPNGCDVIEGQNVVVTTIEEQLYELTKGE